MAPMGGEGVSGTQHGAHAPTAQPTLHATAGGLQAPLCSPLPAPPSQELCKATKPHPTPLQGCRAAPPPPPKQGQAEQNSKICCQAPHAVQPPLPAPHSQGGGPPGYLGRGCLQCRFTLKLLPSPSLPGWRGPEPWARGNHSAGGLAPFSSATGWQATELPSAQASTETPACQPGSPLPREHPLSPGCPQGWACCAPPVHASPLEATAHAGTRAVPSAPQDGVRHRMYGVAFWGRTPLFLPLWPCLELAAAHPRQGISPPGCGHVCACPQGCACCTHVCVHLCLLWPPAPLHNASVLGVQARAAAPHSAQGCTVEPPQPIAVPQCQHVRLFPPQSRV